MTRKSFVVQLRGVRGSIPTPVSSKDIESKLRRVLEQAKPEDISSSEAIDEFVSGLPNHLRGCVGGNSTCIQVTIGDRQIFFDAGSGCCEMAKDLFKIEFGRGKGEAKWFFTHTHHDHLVGLPMFGPLYVPGNIFSFHSPYPDLKDRFKRYYASEFFPVPFESLASTVEFIDLTGKNEIIIDGDIRVTWLENDHPGQSFSYRVDYGGSSVILSTDAEYKDLSPKVLKPVIDFFSGADVLIFDAQYAFTECVELKRDWGHSSQFVGIDLALDAQVKQLILFHHEPTSDDFRLVEDAEKSKKYLKTMDPDSEMEVLLGIEGMTFHL